MSLTTKDIYEKTFKRTKKGFDEDEVDKFLDQVIDELKAKQGEIDFLRKEIQTVRDLEANIKGTEGTIMNTLVSAQKSSERILREAARKAELLIDNAENTAKQKTETTKHELVVLERKLAAIKQSAHNYAMSFTEMVNAQSTSFEKTYQTYFGDMDVYSSSGISFDALERIDKDISKGIEEIVGSDGEADVALADFANDETQGAPPLEVEWSIPNDELKMPEAFETDEQEPAPQDAQEEPSPPEEVEEEFVPLEEIGEEFVPLEKVEEEPAPLEKVEEEPAPLEKVEEDPSTFEKAQEEPEPLEEAKEAPAPLKEDEETVSQEAAEEKKPVDGMPLNEINKVLTDIEEGNDDLTLDDAGGKTEADKTKFDDYSWLYGDDEKKEKSDFELSFKDPKEGQELKSLIDDVIE